MPVTHFSTRRHDSGAGSSSLRRNHFSTRRSSPEDIVFHRQVLPGRHSQGSTLDRSGRQERADRPSRRERADHHEVLRSRLKFAPTRETSVADLDDRLMGESAYSSRTPAERLAEIVAADLVDLVGAVHAPRREDEQRFAVHRRDLVSARRRLDRDAQLRDDYADRPCDTVGCDRRSDRRTSRRQQRTIIANSGLVPDVVVMGADALSAFLDQREGARSTQQAAHRRRWHFASSAGRHRHGAIHRNALSAVLSAFRLRRDLRRRGDERAQADDR